jgi:hypothetical protein
VRSKILVVLVAVAVMGVSSAVMARGGGGGKSGGGLHGHGHFVHNQFRDRFGRNPFFFGDGFDWGFGGPYYGEGNGSNTTVVVFPQATPQAANVTGSVDPAPCHWNEETFKVPSSTGGPQPISVVSCR